MENTSILENKPKKIYLKPILIFIGCFVAEIVAQLLFALLIPKENPYRFVLAWFLSKLVALTMAVVFFRGVFKESAKSVRKSPLRFMIYLVIAFAAFYLVEIGTSYYSMFMDKLFNTGESTNQSSIIELFKSNPQTLNYVLLFLTVGVIAPILEELEFRVMVFDALKGVHFSIPLAISAILFGFVHMSSLFSLKEWAYFPMYALPGLALGLVYFFGGKNCFINILCHMGINIISFIQIMNMINQATQVVEI